ncbi:MAG TPA: molybdopterin-synthase adenylyltransferase MoeB [Anaerolineales bacterium]|nr:molybdopterin-synthase adenylyltransferase MoeB [Anaerolineales bacterium]
MYLELDTSNITLSKDEINRFSRHLIMPEVALEGQKRLKAAKVLCVGTGGLGSPLALYLAAAGVGTIGLVDYDIVEASNLQRQVIHGQSTVGMLKVESAKQRLLDINPHINVITYNVLFTSQNALEIAKDYDVIIDGTDNFPTRYLVDDVCALLGKPNVYGSIFRFEGQVSVFWAKHGPTYRDLFPEPPPPGLVPSCAEGGVLGILPGTIGTVQATEAIKLITGIGEPLIGRMLLYDALEMRWDEIKIRRNPKRKPVTELIDYEEFCGLPQNDHVEDSRTPDDISVQDLQAMFERGDSFRLIDVREPHEWEIVHIEGAELIPLGDLPARLHELDSTQHYVLQCRSGKRSATAVQLLKTAGITRVKNLAGGVLAWAEEIDDSLPIY